MDEIKPLMFIETPCINKQTYSIQRKFDSQKKKKLDIVFGIEKRIIDVVDLYKKNKIVLVELKTINGIKEGIIIEYLNNIVMLKTNQEVLSINVENIQEINILKIG